MHRVNIKLNGALHECPRKREVEPPSAESLLSDAMDIQDLAALLFVEAGRSSSSLTCGELPLEPDDRDLNSQVQESRDQATGPTLPPFEAGDKRFYRY